MADISSTHKDKTPKTKEEKGKERSEEIVSNRAFPEIPTGGE
jgi:hypothetical protein